MLYTIVLHLTRTVDEGPCLVSEDFNEAVIETETEELGLRRLP